MIKMITNERMNDLIENKWYDNYCDFFITYHKDTKTWVACDNSSGDKWVEEFKNLDLACKWLRGDFEVC